jgi:dynein heavy chain
MIDPQTQANKWIKSMENDIDGPAKSKSNSLLIVKPNDNDFTQRFEQAIRMGQPIILENVGE